MSHDDVPCVVRRNSVGLRTTVLMSMAIAVPNAAHTAIPGMCEGPIRGGGLVSDTESVGAAVRGHTLHEAMRTLPVLVGASLLLRTWCGACGQYRKAAFGSFRYVTALTTTPAQKRGA